ncbi:ORF6N domain-containing protein [Peptostreptococcus equinus]|uniref:ORF6N domain-containing protein n=1 Tax=Peptostreptococcus equinus TaxID=3003601 RepID=A0ABY7JLX7_9FIRM|nr:ORF6N domain-containing protein [Peptostreptococcus sp. CBA3647]WAW14366.1 ORF6N domain-containing protein [Peptostreptococcus sp. CBA3647]
MSNLVKINNQEITLKEWKGQRVVTFADIDYVHGRPKGTAKRNFSENKKHFIEGEDYILATVENTKKYEIRSFKIPPRGLILLTETGYLMLVKSFTDDLAWTVQRALVNNYFKSEKQIVPTSKSTEYKPTVKRYGADLVLVTKDLAEMLETSVENICSIVKKNDIWCYRLENDSLKKFKRDNPSVPGTINYMFAFNKEMTIGLLKHIRHSKESLEKIETYFNVTGLSDYDKLKLIELAKDIQNVSNNRGYNTPYANMLNIVASKIYVDCGFLSDVTDDISINTSVGTCTYQKLINFRGNLKRKLI